MFSAYNHIKIKIGLLMTDVKVHFGLLPIISKSFLTCNIELKFNLHILLKFEKKILLPITDEQV